MSFSLADEVAINAGGISGASQTATLSSAPAEGQLIVIPFSVNNAGADFQVSLPGFTATIAQSDSTFRTIGMFHKVAGASEPSSYTLTMTGSAVLTGVARVFDGVLDSVDARPVIHGADTVGSIGDTLTAAAGSAVVAFAYTSSTAGKTWNAGWSTPVNPARQSSVYKVSAGDSETAIMTLDDEATNNRLSMVMAEFVEATEPSGPSITAADNITDETQPATVTLANNTAAPTAITINGTAATGTTDEGAGVYSYAPPLIADDDTTELAVTVDGETLTASISYANTYDRDQLTHAEPNANSLNFGNQYATTLPYEWKVITDADPSVLGIDWDELEANDGLNDDISLYATGVSVGTTSVTIGVFVPETGQAVSFQRTIVVGDGGVPPSNPVESNSIRATVKSTVRSTIRNTVRLL